MQITTMALTWVFLLFFCAYYHKPSNVFLAFWIQCCWPRAACLSVCPRNILMIKCSPVCLFNRYFNFHMCHDRYCQLPEVASIFFLSRILVWSYHAETPLTCFIHFDDLRVFLWWKTWNAVMSCCSRWTCHYFCRLFAPSSSNLKC